MIIDSSALLAVSFEEPEGHLIDVAILQSPSCRMSSGNFLESCMILQSRKGTDAVRDLDLLMYRFKIEIVAFTETQARIARAAFERFGKGRHPAGLNFGDCMAYALAKQTGEVLLFKGTDFGKTDIAVAAY